MQPIRILIGVCTYKRPKMLQQCMESFLKLELPDHFQTTCLVVNNDTKSIPRALTNKFESADTNIKFLFRQCLKRGIPYARNTILKHADNEQYDFCLFIDDDERPSPTWVQDLIIAQESQQSAAIQGNVINEYERTPWLTLPLIHKQKFTNKNGSPVRVVSTCNVLLHRRLFGSESYKLRFNEQFALTGGSDKEFFLRVQESYNETCTFANTALVYETIPKDRVTLSWFFQRFSRVENNSLVIKIGKIGILRTTLRITPKVLARALSCIVLLVFIPLTLIIPSLFRCTLMRLLKNAARTKGAVTALLGKKAKRLSSCYGLLIRQSINCTIFSQKIRFI